MRSGCHGFKSCLGHLIFSDICSVNIEIGISECTSLMVNICSKYAVFRTFFFHFETFDRIQREGNPTNFLECLIDFKIFLDMVFVVFVLKIPISYHTCLKSFQRWSHIVLFWCKSFC